MDFYPLGSMYSIPRLKLLEPPLPNLTTIAHVAQRYVYVQVITTFAMVVDAIEVTFAKVSRLSRIID